MWIKLDGKKKENGKMLVNGLGIVRLFGKHKSNSRSCGENLLLTWSASVSFILFSHSLFFAFYKNPIPPLLVASFSTRSLIKPNQTQNNFHHLHLVNSLGILLLPLPFSFSSFGFCFLPPSSFRSDFILLHSSVCFHPVFISMILLYFEF